MTKFLSNKIIALLRSAFPNHEEMLTDGLGRLIVYFLYVSFAVLSLPFILANKWFCMVDFSESGQVGDTIGGVMGPFIALIAAFLTFMAFWIQYRANEKQNAIAKKQLEMAEQQNEMMAKQTEIAQKQERKYAIERFENTLHQMLDVYSRNSEAVKVGDLTGKEAFEEMAAELFFIYYMLDRKYRNLLKYQEYETKDKTLQKEIWKVANSIWDAPDKKKSFLTTLAYELFFYGTNVVTPERVYHNKGELLFANELVWHFKKIEYHRSEKITYKSLLKKLTKPKQDESGIHVYFAQYQMALGHNAHLGHYYRQMLQIVKFISEAPPKMFDERQKYDYAKMLRSQLCDAEQVLLYYNSLSLMGQAWNERHGNDDDDIETWGYILRFRLIKNIPTSYPLFGMVPIKYYRDEIKKWEEKYGESFFETEVFAKFGKSE